jgi:hypothetical protein
MTTDKALRLAEDLEGLACNGPDNCESGRVMRAAASLIRAQQEEVKAKDARLETDAMRLDALRTDLREMQRLYAAAENGYVALRAAVLANPLAARAALTEEK